MVNSKYDHYVYILVLFEGWRLSKVSKAPEDLYELLI